MKFSAALIFAAGAAAWTTAKEHPTSTWGSEAPTTTATPWTTSTVYSTQTFIVTSCGPEVVSCPAHSTLTVTSVVAVSTTVCPVTETWTPAPPPPPSSAPESPISASTCPTVTETCTVTVTVGGNSPTWTNTWSSSSPVWTGTGSPSATWTGVQAFTGAANANNAAGIFVAGAGALAAMLF